MLFRSGIRVLDVAVRYEVMRMSPDEIMATYPHLTLAQIHAALSYYYANKKQLDKEWHASLKKVSRQRRERPSALEQKLGQVMRLHG